MAYSRNKTCINFLFDLLNSLKTKWEYFGCRGNTWKFIITYIYTSRSLGGVLTDDRRVNQVSSLLIGKCHLSNDTTNSTILKNWHLTLRFPPFGVPFFSRAPICLYLLNIFLQNVLCFYEYTKHVYYILHLILF